MRRIHPAHRRITFRPTALLVAAVIAIGSFLTSIPAPVRAGATTSAGAIVAIAARPGGGYWTVSARGAVEAAAGAPSFGDLSHTTLARPITGMAATPTGSGYWLVATDGGIFSYGDARFYGSTGGMRLNRSIVGMAATPSGHGYWLVATDGGIFSYGDARFSVRREACV